MFIPRVKSFTIISRADTDLQNWSNSFGIDSTGLTYRRCWMREAILNKVFIFVVNIGGLNAGRCERSLGAVCLRDLNN